MIGFRVACALILSLVLGGSALAAVPDPVVSVPPAGIKGFPLWDSWFDLGPFGYVEEEFFISGTASETDLSSSAPYTTRIILTRPANQADFNGTVLMDWVNVTAQFEIAVDSIEAHDFLIREGYAFVHVSAQTVGLCCNPLTPQGWDPVRYASISHPGDQYALSMFAQIAKALRAPAGLDPMGGLTVDRVIATGQSQSAQKLHDYLDDAVGVATIGEDVIDALLIHGRVADTHDLISTAADAKQLPVLQLNSDLEAYGSDPIASPWYSLWDAAGAAHVNYWVGTHSAKGQSTRFAGGPKLPSTADEGLHDGDEPPFTPFGTANYGEQVDSGQPFCIVQGNQYPMQLVVRAAIHAVDQWLRTGATPPSSPRYELDNEPNDRVARDEFSNALGGIRLAPIEHPIASYLSTTCGLGGTTFPFTEAQILDLYPTHADYVCQMQPTTYQNVKDGWLLEEDAENLLTRVANAQNRWPADTSEADCDADGVPDAIDNCPLVANASQLDRGGLNSSEPDGIGDACQCGDVTGNGIVNGQDANAIRRHGLGLLPNPPYRVPSLCDVSGNGTCNGQDAGAIRAAALGNITPLYGQNCQPADPYAPDCEDCGLPPTGQTFFIQDGPNEQLDTLAALFSAVRGDTIEFGPGLFTFSTTLVMAHKEDITIRGQGQDQTVLDFHGANSPEGISVSHMTGFTVEDLTVWDTPGFSIKVSDSHFVTIKNVRTGWSSADSTPGDGDDDRGGMDPAIPSTLNVSCDYPTSFPVSNGFYTDKDGIQRPYVTDSSNGGYAIYPVLSEDVLIENVISVGSSDAGIYVGQSKDVIIRNSEAIFNVAGFEIENTDNADVYDNIAHCNTGGFLTFDLPGLNRYGDKTRTYNNYSGYNNTDNFAPGGIVSLVPSGIGVLQLGYDEHEIFGNTIEWNRSVGLVYVGHEIIGGSADLRMDYVPDAAHIHDNVFTSNGTQPEPPDTGVIVCAEDTGPGFVPPIPPDPTWNPCVPTDFDDGNASLLPALIQIKGSLSGDGYGPTGAHIVWDGLYDDEEGDYNYNVADGDKKYNDTIPCPLDPAFAGILDANGRPQYDGTHNPSCRYNAYKFTDPMDPATRRHPQYWSCIADTGDPGANSFSIDSRKFMNFDGVDPTVPPKLDIDDHDCPLQFGTQLAALPAAVVETYVPGAGGDPQPSQDEIDEICSQFSGGDINRDALPYNCQWLSQYNLFSDPTDPRTGAHEGGVLFDLTTPLFSDYAVKYRILFLPPGESAGWKEGSVTESNATLDLPVGTVIAKTFAFRDTAQPDEDVVETRLLIHRLAPDGGSFWEGVAYIWETDGSGNRTDAQLAVGGGTASVSWNFPDPDPDVSKTYVGATTEYAIPHANQCGNCHNNDDKQPGDAPIGLKVRNLNRPMDYGSGPENQLQHWIDLGILAGAPALSVDANQVATNVLRNPRFDVVGDTANIPPPNQNEQDRLDLMTSSEIDIELRTRAWLEANCAHCHNQKGLAQSTGVFLDTLRVVNLNYGICKSPTTAGSSSGGNDFDIVPGASADSIMSFRIHQANPSTQMPPIARSVAHDEAVALFDQWVDSVVDGRYEASGCEQ